MSSNHKLSRKKCYKKYEPDVIEAALREYEEKKSSFKVIADKHNVPKSVLHRHYTRFMKKQGGQTVLNHETEKYIVKYLNICSEWGYPLDTYDLRILVKGYLDRVGTEVKKFKNNLPGPDFVRSFLSRHKQDISLRLSQNIKRTRAAVSPEKINQYFDELGLSVEDVPLCNILNYDETNLSDDPGRRKIICKRGAKYPERVMNHSKGSISLMMAAAADGTLLPPYVVYKSQHLYDTWTTGGPKGCRYNRTTSGWFDGTTFEEWVQTVVYGYFKEKSGKKIIIGDNLSSHLSINLIRECKERDINFVFLPSNSTHITQPLDVAFFRPMKMAWRDILFNWKKSDGRTQATVPKNCFPQLLKKLLQKLEDNAKQNILSGFSKAGISPLNRKRVLDRLPNNYERDDSIFSKESVDNAVLNMLKEMRYGTGTIKVCNKKKKLNVIPGKSVGSESEYASTDSTDSHNEIVGENHDENILSDKVMKKKKLKTNSKNNNNQDASSIKKTCKSKKRVNSTKVETVNETYNVEDDYTRDKKKVKGKGVGKRNTKKHKEQTENERNIENNIEKIALHVNNSLPGCSFSNDDKRQNIVKIYSNRSVDEKTNQNKAIKILDEKTIIFKIPSVPVIKTSKNYAPNEKKKKEKEIEKKSLKEELNNENDIHTEYNRRSVDKIIVTGVHNSENPDPHSNEHRMQFRISEDLDIEDSSALLHDDILLSEGIYDVQDSTIPNSSSNKKRLQSRVSEHLDIENMPVLFDDGILLSEVIIDDSKTEKENIDSKFEINTNEKVKKTHLKRVSLTDPIEIDYQLKNKRNKYYKNDEDILRDLMDQKIN